VPESRLTFLFHVFPHTPLFLSERPSRTIIINLGQKAIPNFLASFPPVWRNGFAGN
jgi:hypothetical protein